MQEHDARGIDLSLEPLDGYGPYPETPVTDPTGNAKSTRRVTRGGSWYEDPADCRTGVVTAVGTESSGIEPGDKVLFPSDAGYEVRLAGAAVKVMRRSELIALDVGDLEETPEGLIVRIRRSKTDQGRRRPENR